MLDIIYTETSDNLEMMGTHFSGDGNVCVVEIPGQSATIIENKFSVTLGYKLQELGVGYIYGHNRGYGHINDIRVVGTKEYKRCGAQFEVFEESLYDIAAWVRKAKELGYSKIILLGHSLGVSKMVAYYYKYKPEGISGIVMAGSADMVGLEKENNPKYGENIQKTKKIIGDGKGKEIFIKDWYEWFDNVSAQTYYTLSAEGEIVDCLPLLDKEKPSKALENVQVPVLIVWSSNDSVLINGIEEDTMLLKKKLGSNNVEMKIVEGDHVYRDNENEYAEKVSSWVLSIEN